MESIFRLETLSDGSFARSIGSDDCLSVELFTLPINIAGIFNGRSTQSLMWWWTLTLGMYEDSLTIGPSLLPCLMLWMTEVSLLFRFMSSLKQ